MEYSRRAHSTSRQDASDRHGLPKPSRSTGPFRSQQPQRPLAGEQYYDSARGQGGGPRRSSANERADERSFDRRPSRRELSDYPNAELPQERRPMRSTRARSPRDADYDPTPSRSKTRPDDGQRGEVNLDGEAASVVPNGSHPREPESSWSWNSLKKTVWGEPTTAAAPAQDPGAAEEETADQEGDPQNTLWSKLAFVGATLQKKINGDEGYASDASDYQGESHLIRIMKQYHTEKAQSKEDLPDWLFTEAEIITASAGMRAGGTTEEEARPAGARAGLGDIFEAVEGRVYSPKAKQSFDSGYASSTATPQAQGRQRQQRARQGSDSEPGERPVGRNRLAPLAGQPGASSRSERGGSAGYCDERSSFGRSGESYAPSRSATGRSGYSQNAPVRNPVGFGPTLADRRPPPFSNDRYAQRPPRGPPATLAPGHRQGSGLGLGGLPARHMER